MNTTERDIDIQVLRQKYGVSPLLTESLIANPKEARECIQFFKLMMYLVNGGVIALGVLFMWYGFSNKSLMGYGAILVGSLLILKFAFVFIRQVKATRAMVRVAKKHSLI